MRVASARSRPVSCSTSLLKARLLPALACETRASSGLSPAPDMALQSRGSRVRASETLLSNWRC